MDAEERDLFLAQYKAVSDQIIHWDTFFWSKSRFFLAVEGVAIFGVGKWLVDQIRTEKTPTKNVMSLMPVLSEQVFWIFATAIVLNVFLCIVWLRTGRRNREFLNTRFEVGRAMEEYAKSNPVFWLYTYTEWKIKAKMRGPSSHPLEIGIPMAFLIAWLVILWYLMPAGPLTAFDFNSLVWGMFGLVILVVLREAWIVLIQPPPEAAGPTDNWAEFQRDNQTVAKREVKAVRPGSSLGMKALLGLAGLLGVGVLYLVLKWLGVRI